MSSSIWGAQRPSASNRIALGVVGIGGRGLQNLRAFLSEPSVQVVAVCDVDRVHDRQARGRKQKLGREPARQLVDDFYSRGRAGGQRRTCREYVDFRGLCARPDIDAVLISTPDHWHALVSLEALRQGKDVYCEKPLTHFFREGQRVRREAADRKAVFQTGSQQRSMPLFQHAVELVQNGHLGTIKRIEIGLPSGYDVPQADATVTPIPQGLDYDLWCGPSPVLPYMPARHHRWWRGHRAYGGGTLMDWIGHHNDIAHWSLGLDHSGPRSVEARNWVFPKTKIYNTPVHFEIACEYPAGVAISISDRYELGVKWIGAAGWLFATRGKMQASDARWIRPDFERGSIKVEASSGHYRNFLDCVKSRASCVAPPDVGHRSITPGHLGYLSQALGRPIRWNPEREEILDDPQAAKMLMALEYRAPWAEWAH